LETASGGCLCGAVRFLATDLETNVGACHCHICRNWGGGPLMEVECGTNVRFEGGGSIRTYQSSPWAERGFCGQCGTHLYVRTRPGNELGVPESYGIPAGLFDDTATFVFTGQVFIDQKPAYYGFANTTKEIASPDIYAKHPAVCGVPTRP
jgi:hypothetical protein